MNNGDMNSIFEQINNLKKPITEPTETKKDFHRICRLEPKSPMAEQSDRE